MKRKKKRKLKVKRIIILLLLIIIIVGVVLYLVFNFKKDDNKNLKDTSNKTQEVSDGKQIYKASMVMVGDNIIHESVYKDALKNGNNTTYDFKPMYELVKPIISKYDIAYVNQETVLGGSELGVSGYPTFNSPYEVGDDLIDTGFNLVSLATNHLLDSGVTAVKNSREYWNKQDSVLAVGSYMSESERNEVQIKEVNNITYTMLNYTYGVNGYSVSEDYLVNVWPTSNLNTNVTETTVSNDTKYQEYKEQVKEDVERVRDKVDVLIVAMHWGVEYNELPTAYQKDAAKFLASLGVDIVIGTHPHIIEPVEWLDNTLVYYSLGNFLSSQYQDDYYNKVVGLMGSLEITKTVEDGTSTISIDNVCNELLFTYYEDVENDLRGNIKIIPFSSINETYLKDYKKVYETYKKVVQTYDSNICVKEIS
jgi:poly-gamma-glutamate synthesis protein (capsule biosynthesis protein)